MLGTVNKLTLDELNLQVEVLLEKRVAAAQATLARFKADCSNCRSLHSEYIRSVTGTFNVHDGAVKLRKTAESGFCAVCDRCIYSDES